jgi:hypothetical protein
MLVRNRFYKLSIIIIILSSFIPATFLSKSAEGAVVNSKILSSNGSNGESREVNLTKIRNMLENKLVAEKLRSHGLSTEEVNQKLNKMGDAQIHQLAALSDRISAGGNGAVAIAIVAIVVVVVFVIVLIVWKRV